MKKLTYLLKNYPLTLLCLSLIFYLSLFWLHVETPFDGVDFIDKWTHLVMYGGTCAVMWWEYLRRHRSIVWWKLWLFAIVGMVALGGFIELLQPYFNRSGEWLDFVADTVGVGLGAVAGLLFRHFQRP